MTDEPTPRQLRMQVELFPLDDAGACDYYANLTGVGNMQHEVVLFFGHSLPRAITPDEQEAGKLRFAPRLRVTMPPETAANLLTQVRQQLEVRARLEDERRRMESEDAEEPSTD